METWLPVLNYEGFYEVSNFGNVRSVKRTVVDKNNRLVVFPGKKISAIKNNVGAMQLNLHKNGCRKTKKVHKLVTEAFLGKPIHGYHVAHNDGDFTNNHLSNLRYATPAENQMDRVRHGTSNRGSRHGNSKLTEKDVINIRKMGETHGVAYLSKKYKIHVSCIYKILGNRAWKHI